MSRYPQLAIVLVCLAPLPLLCAAAAGRPGAGGALLLAFLIALTAVGVLAKSRP